MERLKAVVRRFEFHVLLFVAGLALFAWPLLAESPDGGSDAAFWSLFLRWAIVIALLFFASLAYRTPGGDTPPFVPSLHSGQAPLLHSGQAPSLHSEQAPPAGGETGGGGRP